MIDRGSLNGFVRGLRETLVNEASVKSDKERQSDPKLSAQRRSKIKKLIAGMDQTKFDPELSDEKFWHIAAMKPFYAGKRASGVDKRVDHMLRKYLGDRLALQSPEWNEGGKRFEKFLKDSGSFRNRPNLKKVIYAARRINEWKKVNEKSIIEFYTYKKGDVSSPEALKKIYEHLSRDLKLGSATTFHLMTELGFQVIKPDRVVNRSSVRMGWISGFEKNGATYPLDPNISPKAASDLGGQLDFIWALQAIYTDISEATGVSMRSLDYIVVKLGQEPDPENGYARTICHAKKPLCHICSVKPVCAYGSKQ